jgi:hypothetical protein
MEPLLAVVVVVVVVVQETFLFALVDLAVLHMHPMVVVVVVVAKAEKFSQPREHLVQAPNRGPDLMAPQAPIFCQVPAAMGIALIQEAATAEPGGMWAAAEQDLGLTKVLDL